MGWEKQEPGIARVGSELQNPPSFDHLSSPNQRAQTWCTPPVRDPPGSRRAKRDPHGEKEAWQTRRAQVIGMTTAQLWSGDSLQRASHLGVGNMGWTEGCESTRSLEPASSLKAPSSWPIAPSSCKLHLVCLDPSLAEYSTHQENHCPKELVRKLSKRKKN